MGGLLVMSPDFDEVSNSAPVIGLDTDLVQDRSLSEELAEGGGEDISTVPRYLTMVSEAAC